MPILKWTIKQAYFSNDGTASRDIGWCLWNWWWNADKSTSSTCWNSSRGKFHYHNRPVLNISTQKKIKMILEY